MDRLRHLDRAGRLGLFIVAGIVMHRAFIKILKTAPTRRHPESTAMSDILKKIVATKREEIALALKKTPLAAMRADAESRLLTRDFGRAAHKIAAGLPAVIAEVKKGQSVQGRDPRRFRPGRHRAELRRIRRGLPVGADRPPVFPGLRRLPQAGARVLRPAGAAARTSWSIPTRSTRRA